MTEASDSGWALAYYDRPIEREAGLQYAGIFERWMALWIDELIGGALSLPFGIPMAFFFVALAGSGDSQETLAAAIGGLALAAEVIGFLYRWFAAAVGGGWGKRLMRMRVVRERDGLAPGLGTGLARAGTFTVLSIVPVVGGILALGDCVWAIGSDRRQAWHDRFAGTLVLKYKRMSRM